MPKLRSISVLFSAVFLATGFVSGAPAIAQSVPTESTELGEPREKQFIKPRYGVNFTTGAGAGYESSFGSFYGWLPLWQDGKNHLVFSEVKTSVDSDAGNWGGNFALGYRNSTAKTILGGYFGYDVQDLGEWTAHQLGLGLEAINPAWEARLNGYLPVGDRRQIIDFSTAGSFSDTNTAENVVENTAFQENNLLISSQTTTTTTTTTTNIQQIIAEESLAGLDFEVGAKLAGWKNGNLKGFLGSYLYDGDRTGTFVGIRSRLQAHLSNLKFGVALESDGEFGTNLIFSFGADFGGQKRAATNDQQEAISSPLERQTNIARQRYSDRQETTTETVTEEISNTDEIALNPDTGEAWYFSHVTLDSATDGDGTEENPHNLIASGLASVPTDGNGIVYVEGTGTQAGFQIPAKVRVLSSAPEQLLSFVTASNTTTETTILSRSGTGDRPIVTSDVTFTDGGGELNGFELNTGGSIFLENIGGEITIANNIINNSDGDAIEGYLGSGMNTIINISNNQINNPFLPAQQMLLPSADGIDIELTDDAIVELLIEGNTITNAQNSGIELEAIDTSILNTTIVNNTINNSGGDGILLLHDSSQTLTLIAENNSITTTGINGNGITQTIAPVDLSAFMLGIVDVSIDIGAGGFGIGVITLADGDLDLAITNNQISDTKDAKIGIAANPAFLYLDSTIAALLAGTVPGSVTPDNPFNTIFLQSGFAGSSRVDADIFGNILTGTGAGIRDLSALTGTNMLGYELSDYNNGSFTAIAGNNGTVCLNLENNVANTVNGSAYQFIKNNSPQITDFVMAMPFIVTTAVNPELIIGVNSGNIGSQATTNLPTSSGTCN